MNLKTMKPTLLILTMLGLAGPTFQAAAEDVVFDFSTDNTSFAAEDNPANPATFTEDGVTLTATAVNDAAENPTLFQASLKNANGLGVGPKTFDIRNNESIAISFDEDVLIKTIVLSDFAGLEVGSIELPGKGNSFTVTNDVTNTTPSITGGPEGVTYDGAGRLKSTIAFGTPFVLEAGQAIVISSQTDNNGLNLRGVTLAAVAPEPD